MSSPRNALKRYRPYVFSLAALWAAFLLPEILLRIANKNVEFAGIGLARIALACLAAAATVWMLGIVVPNKKVMRVTTVVLLALFGACAIAEVCTYDFFGIYYQASYMLSMGGQVAGDFADEAVGAVLGSWWVFPLAFAPALFAATFRTLFIPDDVFASQAAETHGDGPADRSADQPAGWTADQPADSSPKSRIPLVLASLAICVAAHATSMASCHVGGDFQYCSTEYTANSAIPRFGLMNSLHLECRYAIFGMPSISIDETADAPIEELKEDPVYEPNVTDIDFEALAASAPNDTVRALDQYFAAQTPTSKNEYTGMFEGKNLIFITAEGFSYKVIDPELTPTLYKLANNGFTFNNFYQPDWTQSTTGGEFANMTGIIPTWVNGGTAFRASAANAMPYGMGTLFSSRGYTTKAFHNNTYTYYDRHLTHPNLGYDYVGIGNGLELESAAAWPASDLELMQATIGEYIDAYVADGTPFHTYYMSVSGHCNYDWGANAMSAKNRAAVEGIDAPDVIRAYIACQLELESALAYLVDALEDAGIAEDTVIVMAPDHYPYGMTENTDADYYAQFTGVDYGSMPTERYRNTLILWCGSMEEPVEVDTPCSSVDIVPTLLNLFGFDYDSRLLSGRDVLASTFEPGDVGTAMNVVVFVDTGFGSSWITSAGTFEASSGAFTLAEGVELEDEAVYVAAVSDLARNRYNMARYVVQEDYYRHVLAS